MKKISLFVILLCFSICATLPLIAVPPTNAQTQTTIALDPASNTASALNEEVVIKIKITNVQGLWGWNSSVTWDAEYLRLESVDEGNFMKDQISTMFLAPINTYIGSRLMNCISSETDLSTASGSGELAILHFKVIKQCTEAPISLNIHLYGSGDDPAAPIFVNNVFNRPEIALASNTVTSSVTLHINGPPTAHAGQNQTVSQGTQVTFNASKSISMGTDSSYTWTFQDNGTQQTLTGQIATYTFNKSGKYTVTLTVTDSLGTDSSSVTITVVRTTQTPITLTLLGIASGQSAPVNQPITIAVDEDTLQGLPISHCIWTFGDRDSFIRNTNLTVSHIYANAGQYTVSVNVTYTDNSVDTGAITFQVGNGSSNPAATQGPDSTSNPTSKPDETTNSNDNSSTLNSVTLPPTILAILIVTSAVILSGSVFWLRKQT